MDTDGIIQMEAVVRLVNFIVDDVHQANHFATIKLNNVRHVLQADHTFFMYHMIVLLSVRHNYLEMTAKVVCLVQVGHQDGTVKNARLARPNYGIGPNQFV
jgi:hypothetical protein